MPVAVMQPYLFPHIGYFQLCKASDKFVFYDDVNFIKGGWINRNRILSNGEIQRFTLPLQNSSANRLICEIDTQDRRVFNRKFLYQLEMSYRKAPYFEPVHSMIAGVLSGPSNTIAELAIDSVRSVWKYLGLNNQWYISSKDFAHTQGQHRLERLVSICNELQDSVYINPEGGRELYSQEEFASKGIELHFLQAGLDSYPQFQHDFIPGLSIIDCLMFNSPAELISLLDTYTLDGGQ